ncbi:MULTISPECIES: hypothetical protein [Borreliella]|uniref:Lipoprotein n=1 Tax=Borreliella valaisiana VS116 TaxID=445987 RepID=C0R891_BORVA|nr:hypothetical protein [Borreliella valaisiana]ACN52645.1 hypothetical protein BVAVS116_A0050 [Borreliella valaisiana VS116]WKC76655.1 hypothetical protein QIA32_00445 [Borreliella valaisiana]WLN25706.1 hypothetical protein KJD10_04565 [Borreliella valaisiana]
MKSKLRKISNKFLILASLLLIISCNANMNANDKNKALNENKLTNISEIIKNNLQVELDFKKELETNVNKNTPPILEIEKIEPEKQEFLLKSESAGGSLMPLETPEEINMAKSEEEIAKIQEKLLLIGASDEITEQELGPNMQKSLNPTTIEFKISRTPDGQTILNPIEKEKLTNTEDKIFDQKEENSTLNENTKTQNQFQKQETYLSKDGNFITKEYAEQVRKSLDKALNAIKNLEKSKEFEFEIEIENLSKDLENSANTADSLTTNNNNIEKTKTKLLEDLEQSELIFEDIKDPLGTSTIKHVIDAANNWKEKENSSQINWDFGSKFHPKPKLYNKPVAQVYKALAEKFTEVKNEYKNTKEQLKVQSKLITVNIRKIIAASKEFATQVRNLILLVEDNNKQSY